VKTATVATSAAKESRPLYALAIEVAAIEVAAIEVAAIAVKINT